MRCPTRLVYAVEDEVFRVNSVAHAQLRQPFPRLLPQAPVWISREWAGRGDVSCVWKTLRHSAVEGAGGGGVKALHGKF